MIKNSTLFYIIDNTDNEENAEIEGKLLELQIKDLLKWKTNSHFDVPQQSTNRVLKMLK
jgi:hypothetical protein